MATLSKPIKYIVAFLLSAIGLVMIGLVLSGRVDTYLGVFFFHGGGLTSLYYGQKLGWLTWDPTLVDRPERRRAERLRARNELHMRRHLEESQRSLN